MKEEETSEIIIQSVVIVIAITIRILLETRRWLTCEVANPHLYTPSLMQS